MEPEEQSVNPEDFSLDDFIVDNEISQTETETETTDSESGPSRRERIITELRSTEKSFVEFLTVLNVFFYKPLQLDLQRHPENPILSEEDVHTIFFNFKNILDLNRQLMRKIQERCDAPGFSYDSSPFADLFMECFDDPNFPLQDEYQKYMNNYNTSLKCLVHHQKTNERFQHFTQEALKKHYGFPNLQSYLITPVQRLPRYVLMLTDLRKHTPASHPDAPVLVEAVDTILEITKRIDEGKDYYEEFMRKEILFKKFSKSDQARIKPLVNADERIVTEAPLLEVVRSKGQQKMHVRYVIITSNYIIITRKKSDVQLKLCYSMGLLSSHIVFEEGDAKKGAGLIQITFIDSHDAVPFFRKQSHSFSPVNSPQFGLAFWQRTLTQCISRTTDAEALMLRSTATKSHVQKALLSAHHWELISIGAQQQDHAHEGSELVTEGQLMDHVFYIQSGAVDVVKVIDGEQKVLVSMYEGSFMGDISFLNAIKTRKITAATATIVTSQPGTSVIKISHDQLLTTLDEQPDIAWRFYFLMGALFGERLIRVNSVLSQNISFGDARKITNRSLSVTNLQSAVDRNRVVQSDAVSKDTDSIQSSSAATNAAPAGDKKAAAAPSSLSKKYASVEKQIGENVLEDLPCKFQVDGSSGFHTGTLLLSRNHLCLYRKVFGKKTQIVVPGAVVLSVKEAKEAKEVTVRYLSVGKGKGVESSQENDMCMTFRSSKNAKVALTALRNFTQDKRAATIEWSKLPKNDFNLSHSANELFQAEKTLLRGHIVVHPGLLLDSVYLLTSGACRVEIEGTEGKRQVVGEISVGETFGELSFLLGTVTSAYVIVSSEQATISHCTWERLTDITANKQSVAVGFYQYWAQMLCKRFLAAEQKAVERKNKPKSALSRDKRRRSTRTRSACRDSDADEIRS